MSFLINTEKAQSMQKELKKLIDIMQYYNRLLPGFLMTFHFLSVRMFKLIIRDNDNRVDNLLCILLANKLIKKFEGEFKSLDRFKWIGPIQGQIIIEKAPVGYIGIYTSLKIK